MNAEELLRRYAAGERDFIGVDLRGIELRKCHFEAANFSQADFTLRGDNGWESLSVEGLGAFVVC